MVARRQNPPCIEIVKSAQPFAQGLHHASTRVAYNPPVMCSVQLDIELREARFRLLILYQMLEASAVGMPEAGEGIVKRCYDGV